MILLDSVEETMGITAEFSIGYWAVNKVFSDCAFLEESCW